MRLAWIVAVIAGCSHAAPNDRPPVRNEPPPREPREHAQDPLPPPGDIGDAACTVDSDCTIGFASSTACCPPESFCGDVVSRRQLQKSSARCASVDCGPPRPSSSCMGVIGTHAACVQGTCARVRDP